MWGEFGGRFRGVFLYGLYKAQGRDGCGVGADGENTKQQREAKKTIEVVTGQLAAVAEQVKDWSKIVIAYEPIW